MNSFLLDGYELMDVSDLVFTNLMIHPETWFAKLEQILKMAMEKFLEEQVGYFKFPL